MARLRDAAVASDWAKAHVRLIDPVPYGPQFFALLGQYDAVLVPSLSDEQPRIIYDAYSQGVTAIGTDTAGIRACLTDGETGMLVPPGDAAALADAMRGAAGDLDRLAAMGARGRDLAAQNTHRGMHRHRARSLIRMLAGTP
jgi:glycosyltransferase involved in cell wall biosynthesis